MKIATKIPLTRKGRKDIPPDKGWQNKYKNFPVTKLEVGYSFDTGIKYEYGKTITVKNTCRKIAKKSNIRIKFAVREWKGKIRVWRVK